MCVGLYFRFDGGRCDKALAAADFAVFDADLEASVLPAAEAAGLLVFSVDFDCVSALPAADFAVFDADFDARVFAAAFAAAGPVFLSAIASLMTLR